MTAITEKATLGQKITFAATLERQRFGRRRTWKENACEERSGIIVGTRTLWDGEMYTEEGCTSFMAYHGHIPAFLVAVALNRKPILIPQHAAVALSPAS